MPLNRKKAGFQAKQTDAVWEHINFKVISGLGRKGRRFQQELMICPHFAGHEPPPLRGVLLLGYVF
jgi:hypothetical protein